MQTSALEKLVGLAGKLDQVTKGWAILTTNQPLYFCLNGLPILVFSRSGEEGLCRRFHVTPEELESCIVALLSENLKQSREAWGQQDLEQVTRPAPELLETIRRAVTPARPRRKVAAKPKKASKTEKAKVEEGRNNG